VLRNYKETLYAKVYTNISKYLSVRITLSARLQSCLSACCPTLYKMLMLCSVVDVWMNEYRAVVEWPWQRKTEVMWVKLVHHGFA